MQTLIVATKNQGKMREIKAILADLPYEVRSMADVGIEMDIEEDGMTFEDNALKKAESIFAIAGGGLPDGQFEEVLVLADDSGLEVDALGGEPGIYSARYGGPGLDDTGRWQLLLRNLEGVPAERRTARFVCAMALVSGNRKMVVRGTVEGSILTEPRGANGFGYDPVFLVNETGMTAAELGEAEKNRISHRGRALEKIAKALHA